MAKLILAVALLDIAAHGVKAGQILEAESPTIEALKKDGQVDPHKEAVAYARSQDAKQVRSIVELAAEAENAAKQALLVRIAELEPLVASTEDAEKKAALQAELDAKQAELKALG